jgi:TIR domain
MEHDAFISHASEDKKGFVRHLAKKLEKHQVLVWYDEFSLKPGNLLRNSGTSFSH